MEKIEEKKIETKEKLPEMKIKFIFLWHEKAGDAEAIEKDLKECDIFCPENLFWQKGEGSFADFFERLIGTDEKSAQKVLKTIKEAPNLFDFQKKIFEFVYKYKKPVFMVDIPYDEPLDKKYEELHDIREGAIKEFLKGDINEAAEKAKDHFNKRAEFERDRELIIADNFQNLLPKILEKYPEMRSKKEIKILSNYGAFHTGIYHGLKKEYAKTKREFSPKNFFYPYETELLRKKRFFPEKEISREEIARFFINDLLRQYFFFLAEGKSWSMDDMDKLARSFSKKIKLSDAEKLCSEIKINTERGNKDFDAPLFILEFLQKTVGLGLPENQEALDRLMPKI